MALNETMCGKHEHSAWYKASSQEMKLLLLQKSNLDPVDPHSGSHPWLRACSWVTALVGVRGASWCPRV